MADVQMANFLKAPKMDNPGAPLRNQWGISEQDSLGQAPANQVNPRDVAQLRKIAPNVDIGSKPANPAVADIRISQVTRGVPVMGLAFVGLAFILAL